MKKIIASLIFLFSILNISSGQYDDPKWEFGGEVGFVWVGFPDFGLNIDVSPNTTKTIKRKNMKGLHALVSAKYNLMGRVQILGGLGVVKAKGEISKRKTIKFIFGGTAYSYDKIIQEYTLIEIPTYFRLFLINERRSIKNQINIYFDLGSNFKIPLKSDLSFSKSEIPGSNNEGELKVNSFFGSYVGFGILINNKITIAITSSRIKSQSKEYNHIKYLSSLKSLSLTVFF